MTRKQIRLLEIVQGAGAIDDRDLRRRLFTSNAGYSRIANGVAHLCEWDYSLSPVRTTVRIRKESRREVDQILKGSHS